MKFLLDLDVLTPMGKKAYNISLLKKIGLCVPDGFVISFSEDFNEEKFMRAVEQIGGFPVAARSSGQIEDLEGASFAGLYETYLNIQNMSELSRAIQKCKESLKANRVSQYIRDKKMNITSSELEESFFIFVQKMVDAKYAGVLFSTDPISGKEEELYIECCHGLGEKLVSGEVDPTKYKVNYFTKKIVEHMTGGEKVVLSQKYLVELVDYTLKSCEYFKMPQDIEWAIDGEDKLWILQSRPITSFVWRNDFGELTNADLKDGGVSSQVCTPLMFSLYEYCMDHSLPEYFRAIRLLSKNITFKATYHFYGRVYWSSGAVKKLLLNMPGFNELQFDRDLGIFKDYGDKGPLVTKLSLKSLYSGLKALFFISREFKACLKMIEDFSNKFEILDESYNHLTKMNHFEELINNYYIPTETSYFRVIYNNSNCQSLFKDYLKDLSKKIGIEIDCVNLMSNLGNVGHMKIATDLAHLKDISLKFGLESREYEKGRESFLKIHYHHGDRELDLLTPRWGEVPFRVDELVAQSSFKFESSDKKFKLEVEKVLSKLSSKREKKKFLSKLNMMRDFLEHREKMRAYSTRAYFLVRKCILSISKEWLSLGLIRTEADIFFLHFNEIIQVIKKINTNKNLDIYTEYEIDLRKKFYETYKLAQTPNDFGHKRARESFAREDEFTLVGIGCSKGIYKGIARVILNIEETHELRPGEILVTKFTDPGWTPVLGRVGAVVTEVGGILSHAAVISREYNIAAVLNCTNATKKIRTGDMVVVNGDEGVVSILKEGDS